MSLAHLAFADCRRFVLVLAVAACSVAHAGGHRTFQDGYVVRDDAGGALQWVSGIAAELAPAAALAHGAFEDAIAADGFGRLKIRTVAEADDDASLFEAIGFAEGYLTAERTAQHMQNMLKPAPPELEEFCLEHNAYLRRQADAYGASDPYWRAVDFLLAKQRGFVAGMRLRLSEAASAEAQPVRILSLSDALLHAELMRLNLLVDVDEISRALAYARHGQVSKNVAAIADKAKGAAGKKGHCSALIKVVGPRVFLGHTTWGDYKEMLRIWKDFSFPHVKSPALANRRISMSSYPGYFASNDDWLVLPDTKMLVLETTNDAYDTARLAKHITPACVSTMMRSIVASMLAAHPRDWYQTFSRENSGSQNNQWMIFSSAAWAERRTAAAAKDIFWVLEQQPGLIVGRDMSEHLLTTGYWGSWNVARFKETLAVSQYLENRDAQCVCEGQRGQLLDEAQRHVASLADLQEVMRKNTWLSSPLSWKCPKCAVAARFDLPGMNASNGCFTPSLFGTLDAKVTDDRMVTAGEAMFVSGPSNIGVPPFSWETAAASLPPSRPVPLHLGHPTGPWAFQWQLVGGSQGPRRGGGGGDVELVTLFS